MSKKIFIVVLILWSIATTTTSLYLWRINRVLVETVITARDFAENSNTSLELLGTCVGNYDTCDAKETKSKLLKLRDEKDKIWSQLQNYDKQLQPLLRMYDLEK